MSELNSTQVDSLSTNTAMEGRHLRIPGTPASAAPAAIDNPKADLAALDNLEKHLYAHRYAINGIASYNGTIDPPKASRDSGEALAILQQEDHELLCSETTGAMLNRLESHPELLTPTQAAQIRILQRDRDELINIPPDEQAEFSRLTSEAFTVWQRAKQANDWSSFEPYLDRIVQTMRTFAGYISPNSDPYDVWLDRHEYGTSQAIYDAFFQQVKDAVVPLLADIKQSSRQQSRKPIEGKFDAHRQLALARDLMAMEGVDQDAVLLLETEHPFTDALSTNYGIIATHVYEDDVLSNVYSMLHEGGHALYETGVNPAYNYTSLKGGTSTGLHESQSRFFENYVGRSEEYIPHLLAVMRKHFPGPMNRVTARQLYLIANRAVPGLIRTEADELTYPLHILVRYEIEQKLMSGEASASDVPRLWSKLYSTYLGIHVPNYTQGPLQDVHWSQGSIGYFPTYTLGSAIGAQLRASMIRQGVDFSGLLAAGNLAPIREWLRVNIWQYGRAKDSGEIIRDTCGEAFSARYYTDYLIEKYTAIYAL